MLKKLSLLSAAVALLAGIPTAQAIASECDCAVKPLAAVQKTHRAPVKHVLKKKAKRYTRHLKVNRDQAAKATQDLVAASFVPSRLQGYSCTLDDLQAGQPTFGPSHYGVHCTAGADAPIVHVSGNLLAATGAPLLTAPGYVLSLPAGDALAGTGTLSFAAASVATLSADLEKHLAWDPVSRTVSIERSPGTWELWQQTGAAGAALHAAGFASAPVRNATSTAYLDFGRSYSRFSPAQAPRIVAQLVMRDGVIRVDPQATAAGANPELLEALAALDRVPTDMQRAWRAAALAQFLAQPELVQLAQQKVAAYHPNNLREFQMDLAKIQDFEIPEVRS